MCTTIGQEHSAAPEPGADRPLPPLNPAAIQPTGGQPTPDAVEDAMRDSGQLPRWKKIDETPPAPKRSIQYRLQCGPNASVAVRESAVVVRSDTPCWWVTCQICDGEHMPLDDPESPPLAEAVDMAVEKVAAFLDFLRAEQSRLRVIPLRRVEAPAPALIDGETA